MAAAGDTLDGLVKRLAKGAGVSLLGDAAGKALAVLSQVIIARLLGAEQFGLYALGLVLFNLAQVLSTMGFSQTALRYVSIYHRAGDRAKLKGTLVQCLGFPFAAGLVWMVLLFLGSDLLASFLRKPDLAPVIRVISLGVPLMSSLMVAAQATRGFHKTHYFVYVRNLLYPAVNLLLAVVLVYLCGRGVAGVAAALVLAAWCGLMLALWFLRQEFPNFARVRASYDTSVLLRFAGPLALAAALQLLLLQVDVLMLGRLRPSADTGIYSVASHVIVLMASGMMAIISVFSPVVADLYHRQRLEKLDSLLKVAGKWVFLLTTPIFVVLVVCPGGVMGVFGAEFAQGWPALLILAVSTFLSISFGPSEQVISMVGKQDFVLYNTAGALLLDVVLNLLLIPRLGMTGAALATGISLLCHHAAALLELWLLLRLSPLSRKYLKSVVAGLGAATVAFFVRLFLDDVHYLGQLAVTVLAVGSTFVILLLVLGLDREDRIVIWAILNRLAVPDRRSRRFCDRIEEEPDGVVRLPQ